MKPAGAKPLRLMPWTVKQAVPWVRRVHRRLKDVAGSLWAVRVLHEDQVVGVALVANPEARVWQGRVLEVKRVAVLEGYPNACSMLYGACSRAAQAMGAEDLVTYTHLDEQGTSVKAAGWVEAFETDGGEWGRDSRQRSLAIDPNPKRRWFAPWGKRARAILESRRAA